MDHQTKIENETQYIVSFCLTARCPWCWRAVKSSHGEMIGLKWWNSHLCTCRSILPWRGVATGPTRLPASRWRFAIITAIPWLSPPWFCRVIYQGFQDSLFLTCCGVDQKINPPSGLLKLSAEKTCWEHHLLAFNTCQHWVLWNECDWWCTFGSNHLITNCLPFYYICCRVWRWRGNGWLRSSGKKWTLDEMYHVGKYEIKWSL